MASKKVDAHAAEGGTSRGMKKVNKLMA